MVYTERFYKLLLRAEEIAKEKNLECIDSYCMTRAMLEGNPYNMCYLAALNLGVSIDRFLEELDKINDARGSLTQAGDKPKVK